MHRAGQPPSIRLLNGSISGAGLDDRSRAEADIRALLFDLIAEESMPLSMSERDAILGDVIDEVFGLGPLEPLLRDTSVSDILVNTYKNVYVERSGKLDRLPTTFQDDRHLMRVIDRIVAAWDAGSTLSSPIVDADCRTARA
jgi:pilus assembly protein CpaF